ncbi:DNA ligase-1 [Klenkia soli]|uniref:DNA ligase n=1 Tax=Klenkia soli TaxID=1052260 RepID=A0A1H0HU55_9ACTN|nr:ATP-dependent DNA ligase [Klenkia soli]SDO22659.1 DNA ligase-1 [Klenkia soli]
MLLADVVTTSAAVGATRARTAKSAAVAALLRAAGSDEIGPVTAWLSGAPRQGKLGAGWRTLSGVQAPPADEPTLTVTAVESALDELAGVAGAGSTARRAELLGGLLGDATADEQSFLLRLLAGELRHGALEGVVLDAVAAAADAQAAVVRRAFFLSGELPAVAELAMTAGVPALEAVRLEVGRPLRPMLASPADDLAAALGDGEVVVEQKMDGARIQVHKDGDDVRVWTRSLKEITARVPELVAVVRGLAAQRLVLDGETLALTDDGRPRPFQETAARFGADAGELLLRPFFFDCLHVDGTDLVDEPLADRLVALARVAPAHRMPGVVRPTPGEAAAFQAETLAAGHEGVVVKVLGSPYAAGRRGSAWRKVKPVHTLDLVVIGAEWGYGRRTGSLSNIHLGARDPDGGPPVMVGKTFKGMTDELLAWQTRTFPALVTAEEGGAVLLRPELVVEIELDGVQRSTRYPGGVALRFARVLRYRPDKEAADADTVEVVRSLLPGRPVAGSGLPPE